MTPQPDALDRYFDCTSPDHTGECLREWGGCICESLPLTTEARSILSALRAENLRMREALGECASVCEAEGHKLDEERAKGSPLLKDERRARAESAYYCAHLVREYTRAALSPLPAKNEETT